MNASMAFCNKTRASRVKPLGRKWPELVAPQRLRILHRQQSFYDWFLSPEILVVGYDLFFEFREWATDCYMAPSGGEH